MVLTFVYADETLKCDIQMKATEQYYFTVVLLIMLYKVGLTFESMFLITSPIFLTNKATNN